MKIKIKENYHVVLNKFHGNFRSKTLSFRKIKYVFRDVKWCFNASWGLEGLKCKTHQRPCPRDVPRATSRRFFKHTIRSLCHADTLSNMVSCVMLFLTWCPDFWWAVIKRIWRVIQNVRIFSYSKSVLSFVFHELLLYHLVNTCTDWDPFSVYLRWNRCLLTKYRHEKRHFCWFHVNMDKHIASNFFFKYMIIQ